ncbi:class II myosin [Lecanora helva]
MSITASTASRWRNNPFDRGSPSPSPGSAASNTRPKSSIITSPSGISDAIGHSRNQSFSGGSSLAPLQPSRQRSNSYRGSHQASNTFAPSFIKTEESQRLGHEIRGIEGENDFSGKRYVWLRDPQVAFVKGWVVEELSAGQLLVQCDDGSQREVDAESVDKVNPAKFDKADDMAELTHLNEASVVHNIHMRYQADLIYTYSGLFLVTVNPYCPLPIYTNEYMRMYRGRSREDTKPHIYAMADEAFRNLVEEGENQSILVTGESGAGKTENTKKVIQYLAAVATSDSPAAKSGGRQFSNLSQQILRANPILEAFGNAQTVRNHNSSRFGKFIRIEFTRSGQIAGAFIDWYLLEKSRVVKQNSNERNYHVFYQLLKSADERMKQEFMISNLDVEDFVYTRDGNETIAGVSDSEEWMSLLEAFHIMGFSDKEQNSIFRTVAAILLLGNVTVQKESMRADQAILTADAFAQAEKMCKLLGIAVDPFVQGLLHPKVKAGREWVEKVQTPEQVRSSLDALSKGIYERAFGDLVSRINRQLDRTGTGLDDSHFIGVLDIAGFEIFEENSFEQLCINYTNEKLQQFFNHHMFVLEQEEYAREQIEWKFIDFGKDLQPTIDLIELPNPIGIFSCLDEDSVMPKATDKSFTEKMHSLWERKSTKYRPSRLSQGFILTHYAAEVEYSTSGWLEKNKDPLNDNITRLLASSSDKHTASLFADCAEPDEEFGATRNRVKKGLFRTVAQRHKEQLSSLMSQLNSTHPHFVRCILPNHKKRPKQLSAPLVLDQLRCNGVLEGIRIARTGFPNRLPFSEFRQRYEVLCCNMPKGHLEGQAATQIMLEKLDLDKALYRVGLTKVFFRAGVLAELEEQRDALIQDIMSRFQSVARGFTQRRVAHKRLYRAEATRIIQHNFAAYTNLCRNPWWRLFVRMKPLLGATRTAGEVKKRDDMIQKLEAKMQQENSDRSKLEEERRRAETEAQRVQQILESERSLALDKEEIFKRLQQREAELTEKLAGAIDDQEHLEDQLDDLVDAKKKAEETANQWRGQLEQAGQIITRLETEKKDLLGQISELDACIGRNERARCEKDENYEGLLRDNKMLESQLHLQQRKVSDLEGKLLKSDQDLDAKLASTTKDLQSSRKQAKELLDENHQIRQQLQELSSTSTSYEDMMRRKESEIAVLRTDQKRCDAERKALESEKNIFVSRHDNIQARLREIQAEMDATRTHKVQLEKEIADTKRILDAKLSEDAQTSNNRRMLDNQINDLKAELFQVQADLSRERQSRDDAQMLNDHSLTTLKEDYQNLNESKITIEKELYVQQDTLRRAVEARNTAEKNRKELQNELKKLRERFLEAETSRLEAEAAAERSLSRQANERQAILRRELDDKTAECNEIQVEARRLADEVQSLTDLIDNSDNFRLQHDQQKERLERELVTVKGRLAASENDNRALLNKVQQKNLDIARSNSRAGDSQRSRMVQIQAEKTKLEEDNKRLSRQWNDAQLSINSLEKQKEKLALNLEDLNHEVEREHKASRSAEKTSSSVNIQLAEANRNLEAERQLKSQAQANTRKLQTLLDGANGEIEESRRQLTLLHRVFNPESRESSPSWESVAPQLPEYTDLARQLEATQQALRVTGEKWTRAENQLDELRKRHDSDISEMDGRFSSSKRHLLEELDQNAQNTLAGRKSPQALRKTSGLKSYSNVSTPDRRLNQSDPTSNSCRSDRTDDSQARVRRMDLEGELEMAQNRLQMSEMQNRHLQSQLGRLSPQRASWQDESPSVRRVQKLERENGRLHDKLDDSAKKVSALERILHAGELSLRDVQAKSHEELYDLINSQEDSRKSLLKDYNNTVADLTESKSHFDNLKHTRASLEVELRDARSELQEVSAANEQESLSRNQLLQEFSDIQIRLDAESSRASDLAASLSLYRRRADEYFNKLEQAEITVLKASRAEQHAKAQAKESEDTYVSIVAERKQMDAQVEDLQRQNQHYEEKVEDLSADLEAAIQAKKRLQHELEDYRSQRAMDVEDKESSMEQTRRKYQNEFSTLTNELEIERENVIHVRSENTRIRDELEELRSKWDDEVLNSSTWAKEKSRLEMTLQDLSSSREEAVNAHNEAQGKIVSLLSQVRNLRSSMDDVAADRDMLQKEKRGLETRLQEAGDRLEDLARGESPSMRNAAGMDRELLDLKATLAQQEDVAAAAVGKMRRADALTTEMQKDVVAEREANVTLHKEKAALEKSLKDLQGRVVDLETKGYSRASQDVRFLNGRIQELEHQLETQESNHAASLRSVRNVDRTVRDLQSQLARRDKIAQQLNDDVAKGRDKIERLLQNIDELQTEDSKNQLAAKRAERDLREEKEKALRLERELEGWKGLRMEKGKAAAAGSSEWGGSVRGHSRGQSGGNEGLQRMLSDSKGFL